MSTLPTPNNNNYDRVRQERSRVDFRAEIVICSIDYSNINLGGVREMIQAPRRTLFINFLDAVSLGFSTFLLINPSLNQNEPLIQNNPYFPTILRPLDLKTDQKQA